MTATLPTRQQARYRGVVYGIDVLDHETRQVVRNDYVGKTRQRGRGRETQHRDDKPWSDMIVGDSHVLWEGMCTEDELDDRERRLIREKAPRLNDRDNRWNRRRIPFKEQVRQRWERDDEDGDPRWVPLDRRQRSSLLEWEPAASTLIGSDRRVSVPRKWSPWQVKAGLWSISWGLSTSVAWGQLARHGHWSTLVDAVAGCGTSALLLVWAVLRHSGMWKMWRQRWRRLRRGFR